jgi:hypothetical protein
MNLFDYDKTPVLLTNNFPIHAISLFLVFDISGFLVFYVS